MKQILIFLILIPFSVSAQSRWHPYGGLHVSMDGAGYYAGPSFQAGTDYTLKSKLSLSAYAHFFPGNVDGVYEGIAEKGKYRSSIIAALAQLKLSKKEKRGLFIGLGLVAQRTTEDYVSDVQQIHTKRIIAVGAMRFGYALPFAGKKLAIELNAVGPHNSQFQDGIYTTYVSELLTQLSLGVRLVF